MPKKDRYITSNFTPAEPEEFKKWCKENKIEIHETGYGDNVYLTTKMDYFASDTKDNPIVRFTKNDNWVFRSIMICRLEYKMNELMGCRFYKVDDNGVKDMGKLIYYHNMSRFFNAIIEETKQ